MAIQEVTGSILRHPSLQIHAEVAHYGAEGARWAPSLVSELRLEPYGYCV